MRRHSSLARILTVTVCCIFIICSTACGKQNNETPLSSAQILTLICDSQGYTENLTAFVSPSDAFNSYVERSFSVQPEDLNDGAVVYMGGIRGDEIVIFHLKDDAMIRTAEESMRGYIESRIEHFNGYVPEIVTMLRNAIVTIRGNHIALLICEQPAEAEKAFFSAFDSEMTLVTAMQETIEPESVPEQEDVDEESEVNVVPVNMEYDKDAIVQAWRTGDKEHLSTKNQIILNRASDTIDMLITDNMSDYEKELAIHDWIINWANYDTESIDRDNEEVVDPDSSTPFGLLINQRAICKGYTYTFQLFMDMLDIECITVSGTANVTRDEHAWNMVRLDGEWYCVDVTWNDPVVSHEIDEISQHTYFNVTSQFMRDTMHHWEEAGVPEATADKYIWRPAN